MFNSKRITSIESTLKDHAEMISNQIRITQSLTEVVSNLHSSLEIQRDINKNFNKQLNSILNKPKIRQNEEND